MSRTAAYDFVRLGRYLERADMTTRILDVRSANLLPRTDGQSKSKRKRKLKPKSPTSTGRTGSV
jgi:uncharacterized alpha-E superfamily protein